MRNLLLILIFAGMVWNAAFSADSGFKTDKYAEDVVQDIRLSPEKYLFKYVSLKVKFIDFNADFTRFMIRAGIKPDRYLWLNVEPSPLPVVMLKQGAYLEMKKDSSITLYCKVMNFSSIGAAQYYLLVEHLDDGSRPD